MGGADQVLEVHVSAFAAHQSIDYIRAPLSRGQHQRSEPFLRQTEIVFVLLCFLQYCSYGCICTADIHIRTRQRKMIINFYLRDLVYPLRCLAEQAGSKCNPLGH